MKKILVLLAVLVMSISVMGLAAGKIGVVFDVGGRGDLSFNDMAYIGATKAADEFGMTVTGLQSATPDDYYPNLQTLAASGEYTIIIGVGFLLQDAMSQVAKDYPNQKFAIIDGYADAPNLQVLAFKENEASAMIGALAGMIASTYGGKYVGIVLGIEIPVLYHFEAGFRFGVNWAYNEYQKRGLGIPANVGLLYVYTGSFSDAALGKSNAQAQLAQGAITIYNVAGGLGIGMIDAVEEKHIALGSTTAPAGAPYFFGVDSDQDWMKNGLYGLASGMKRVDNATYGVIKDAVNGTFVGGFKTLGLKEGGVGISKKADLVDFLPFGVASGKIAQSDVDTIVANWEANRNAIPAAIWQAVADLEAGILDGSIVVPTATNKAEMEAVRALYPLK